MVLVIMAMAKKGGKQNSGIAAGVRILMHLGVKIVVIRLIEDVTFLNGSNRPFIMTPALINNTELCHIFM